MSKIVVRRRSKIFTIISETAQEKSDRIWNEKFQLFVEFMKLYGHQHVSYDKPNSYYKQKFDNIGQWVCKQRTLYRKGELIEWRYYQLEKAGIIWEPLEFAWNNHYNELVEYKDKYGDCDVSNYDKEYPGLAVWLYKQRKNHTKIPKNRFQKLDELGVNWNIRENTWEEMYEKFKKFIKKHGHQRIPYEKTGKNYKPEYAVLSNWAGIQRKRFRSGQLADWRIELLNEVGFLWEPFDTFWNNNYEKLLEFKEIYGHCNVSRNLVNYKELCQWVGRQRNNKKKLSKERFKKLENIGFDWGYSCEKWDTLYDLLRRYYEENGIAYVPDNVSKNASTKQLKMMSQWCKKQIWLYHNNNLPEDRIRLLKEINFDFEYYSTKRDKIWNEKYERLVEYKKKYGHCNVPNHWKDDNSLSRWVERHRNEKDKLPQDKYNKLNELGFTWDFFDDLWKKRIALLKDFKEKHGHCDVTLSKDKSLHGWIRYLRELKKSNLMHHLSDEQINELNELGFNWEIKENVWRKNFQQLVEFKNKNGHCKVLEGSNPELFHWSKYIMSLKRDNKLYILGDEKVKKLDELGFDWHPFETNWESKYQLLVEYKKKHGTCNVSGSRINNKLYSWVRNLRINKLKLSKERIAKLDELEFEW